VKARFGADHAYYAVALNKLGIVVQAQGKYTEAEGLFKRVLAIRDKTLGANHSAVDETSNSLDHFPSALNRRDSQPLSPRRI
jgi:hypothetical protein